MSIEVHETHRPGRFWSLGWTFVLSVLSQVGIVVASLLVTVVSLILVWVGVPLTIWSVSWLHDFADWHRVHLGRLAGIEIERPYLPVPEGGWGVRLGGIVRDPANWRDCAWLLVNWSAGFCLCMTSFCLFVAGVFYVLMPAIWVLWPNALNEHYGLFTVHNQSTSFLTIPLGVACLLVWWLLTPALIRADAWLARWLLAPTERSRLAGRVQQLAVSRADTVDTHAAELRRVERDLHDGAQARLVALGMSLGMADELLDNDPVEAHRLLAEARDATGAALADLRNLVRGIYPPVLAERGLGGAIQALELALPIPVAVSVELPAGRLPEPAESAAYFALSEVLTNVIKHSSAQTASIRASYADERLSVVVEDDGDGGAMVTKGGGLGGIARRLAAFDGTLDVSSPPGGPTVVKMVLPCVLSSPKTSRS